MDWEGVNTVVGLLLFFFFYISPSSRALFFLDLLSRFIILPSPTPTSGTSVPVVLQPFLLLLFLHARRYTHPVHLLFPMFVHFAGAWLEGRRLFLKR